MCHSRYALNGTSRISDDREPARGCDVSPFTQPATSETTNQSLVLEPAEQVGVCQPKRSPPDRNGSVKRADVASTGGESVADAARLSGEHCCREEAGDAAARMLIATPDTMWSTPKVTVATRVEQPAEHAADDADDDAGPRPPLPAPPRAEPGAEDHHPFEADVDDAGSLGEEAAEPGEDDRHRRAAARRRTCRSRSGRRAVGDQHARAQDAKAPSARPALIRAMRAPAADRRLGRAAPARSRAGCGHARHRLGIRHRRHLRPRVVRPSRPHHAPPPRRASRGARPRRR